VTVGSIAKRQKIPPRYLEQLFNRLRRQGLVSAERGPRGGYRLSRPTSQIPVSAVFQSLERSPQGDGSKGIDPTASLSTASLWRQVENAVQTTLRATTLEDLVAQAREQVPLPIHHRFTFHI
jgi:Rrf2 family iron-sulfur cluster assembly transcriptional regulator